jgi:hypothetical protein
MTIQEAQNLKPGDRVLHKATQLVVTIAEVKDKTVYYQVSPNSWRTRIR